MISLSVHFFRVHFFLTKLSWSVSSSTLVSFSFSFHIFVEWQKQRKMLEEKIANFSLSSINQELFQPKNILKWKKTVLSRLHHLKVFFASSDSNFRATEAGLKSRSSMFWWLLVTTATVTTTVTLPLTRVMAASASAATLASTVAATGPGLVWCTEKKKFRQLRTVTG